MNKPTEPVSIIGAGTTISQRKQRIIDSTALALAKAEGGRHVRVMTHTYTLHALHKGPV